MQPAYGRIAYPQPPDGQGTNSDGAHCHGSGRGRDHGDERHQGCTGGTGAGCLRAGILYALSARLFIWSGQVDLIPLQQALAGLLLTLAAVIIAARLPRDAS